MGNMNCDIDSMLNSVNPQLDKICKNLQSAANTISTISIPEDFNASSTLSSVVEQIDSSSANISTIKNWVTSAASKFQSAERKNQNVLGQLLGNLFGMESNSKAANTSNNNTTSKNEGVIDRLIDFGKDCWNELKSTGAKIGEGFLNFAEASYKAECERMENQQKQTSAVLSSVGDTFMKFAEANYQAELIRAENQQRESANTINTVISLGKGITKVAETIFDSLLVLSTAAANSGTFVAGEFVPHAQGVQGVSEELWDGVMAFVAEEHVESAYKNFYENTTVGKYLDEKADSPFKSDGIVTQISSELGYIAGIAVTSAFTGGPAAVAGTAAFGRYTGEYWANARDASWEGLKSKYEKGEISEEEYVAISQIRNLTDEQWANIELQHQQGSISDEDYETFKSIKEMPEEWTTSENRNKGMAYGGANAAWEALQWYVGGNLDDLAIRLF